MNDRIEEFEVFTVLEDDPGDLVKAGLVNIVDLIAPALDQDSANGRIGEE